MKTWLIGLFFVLPMILSFSFVFVEISTPGWFRFTVLVTERTKTELWDIDVSVYYYNVRCSRRYLSDSCLLKESKCLYYENYENNLQ